MNRRTSFEGGTYGSGVERKAWSYYDTATLATGTTVHRLFTTPQGGSKTLDFTNMEIGSQIPRGQKFRIANIKMLYVTAGAFATADVQYFYSMLAKTTMEFIISNKPSMITLTLQELIGACTLTALTPTQSSDNIPVIMPRYHGIYKLIVPITLAEQTVFEVKLTHQTAANTVLDNDLLKISLNGILDINV